jgi:hypothetical protein
MRIDWDDVKKVTLWHYEDLIKKLLNTLAYRFVQECYNHSMEEAVTFALKVKSGYLHGGEEGSFIGEVSKTFNLLRSNHVESYLDLVQRVETREACETFLKGAEFRFEDLIQALNYLFRWVLPFKLYLRELVDLEDEVHQGNLKRLNQHGVKSNLDMLESGRSGSGRTEMSKATGIDINLILELVNRADISRLAYVRGKAVMHLCGGGYNTLHKIADAELERMEKDMGEYYRTIGKSLADFKSVIPLDYMIGGARILPSVVEV